ncbi:hypothetical protein [Nocardia jinanensis]|uniref:Uncharacterized protein n=1 Tax=Nocardia jinanensis TaxID=382504 RepID=A0A917RDH5_9NOCA|nr:hypothetical protein [Nocardia jinanensis]GGL01087.1 hypothetical protein GCM10011588_14670 [Nocardia jinanensis]
MYSGQAGALVRWLLPVVLAIAVSGMHHLPARDGGDTHRPVSSSHPLVSAAPVSDRGQEHAETARCCPRSPAAISAVPPADAPAGHGSGHELLHLCPAILVAALASVLIVAALGRYLFTTDATRTVVFRPTAPARPPPPGPISRRLAVLGVLRL